MLKNSLSITTMLVIITIAVLLLLLVFLLYALATYNRFKKLKNAAEVTLEQIRVAMKKRLDMISELVESVRSYAKFEKETLQRSGNVEQSMNAIQSVEDEIARHRYTYNNIVQEYNTMRDVIPSSLVAASFSFGKMDYLEFERRNSDGNTLHHRSCHGICWREVRCMYYARIFFMSRCLPASSISSSFSFSPGIITGFISSTILAVV